MFIEAIIDSDGSIKIIQGYDCNGNPALRSKLEYPYTYDPFILHRFGENDEANGTAYTDRLWQQDHKKYDRLCMKHFGDRGQYWDQRDPKKMEAFLKDWMDDPNLKLIFVEEHCNHSTGYPVWRLDFRSGA